MRQADGDLAERDELVVATDLPQVLREADRPRLDAALVVDDAPGDRDRDLLAAFRGEDRLEVLDLARAILAEPIEIVDGTITARGPGLGLSWDEAAVAKYLV